MVQEPPGRDGDPQLAALRQFLQTLIDRLSQDDVILDVGSGRGILADALQRIWQDKSRLPWYYAVDLESSLNLLNLPYQIHNHSKKIPFTDFIDARLPCSTEQVKIVVIRNTFHELNIKNTAEVLVALRRIVRFGAQIYVQDMASLPKGERENAGWRVNLLHSVLEKAGFDCGTPIIQFSHSGTEWFTMILKEKAGFAIPSVSDATSLVAQGRKQQIQLSTKRLFEISDSSEETLAEYIMLSAEVAALNIQLQQTQYAATDEKSEIKEVAELPLTSLSASPLDYAEEMQANVRKRSGLSAILSSKNLINLPVLIDRTVSRLWFAGYSQRLLFTIPEVRSSLMNAAKRSVDVRILLVDPDSPAGQARSVSEVYTKADDFFEDVRATIQYYAKFKEELEASADSVNILCDLRLCKSLLSSSFFFADDLCISSFYSANLNGGSGGAFVFKSSSVQSNGYFQVLFREFQGAWGSA